MPKQGGKQDTAMHLTIQEQELRFFTGETHVPVLRGLACDSWRTLGSSAQQAVLGFASKDPVARVDLHIGKVLCQRWVACARKKLWWMVPEWGTSVRELPTETQFLLVENVDQGGYTLLLPLLDGAFRATLKADRDRRLAAVSDDLVLRIESGDGSVVSSQWNSALLVACGTDVFELIRSAVAAAAKLSGEAQPLATKSLPPSVDHFGWCTWDAFYSQVSATGIFEGLSSLRSGGIRPGTLIIDDGWQLTAADDELGDLLPLCRHQGSVAGGNQQNGAVEGCANGEVAPLCDTAVNGAGSDVLAKQPSWHPVYSTSNFVWKGVSRVASACSWKRLSSWAVGFVLRMAQAMVFHVYRCVVEPAGPYSWRVEWFRALCIGPLKSHMLGFYKETGDFTRRIVSTKANRKFSHPDAPAAPADVHACVHAEAVEFLAVTQALRSDHGVKFIYCWHGMPAYWGGVTPEGAGLHGFKARVVFPQPTEGVREVEPAMLWNPGVLAGVGMVDDAEALYSDMHEYLAAAGVDGVKVDCQAGLGLIGSVAGGGANLARRFHSALEASVLRCFPGNHAINCMCHSTENIYQMRHTSIVRASDDFYPRDPASTTPHVAACAYNSLFLSALCQPDWDMFQSQHPAAHLHACARAVSGGPVYVSDKVGRHNFDLLRRLVLRDGSVLRTLRPGLPTADCIFSNPLRDNRTALKVWSENQFSGVVGVFNLQGSHWSRPHRRFITVVRAPPALQGTVQPADVHTMSAVTRRLPAPHCNQFAVWVMSTGGLHLMSSSRDSVEVSVAAAHADIVTFAPAVTVRSGAEEGCFAPVGLVNMLNSGGAVRAWTSETYKLSGGPHGAHIVEVHGEGSFAALCTILPKSLSVDGEVVPADEWAWDGVKLTVDVHGSEEDAVVHSVAVQF